MSVPAANSESCPACGRLAAFKIRRGNTDIYQCGSCDLTFASLHGAEEETKTPDSFFDGWLPSFELQVQIAKTMLADRKGAYEDLIGRRLGSVLEIGCAYAPWAPVWQSVGCDYTGVEILPEVARQAQALTGADIRSGDFMDIEFSKKYDVIYMSQVLEHIEDPVPFLRKAREICTAIHIDVPNHSSMTSTYRKWRHPTDYGFIQPPYHLLAYTKSSLSAVLRRSGFEVLKVDGIRNDDKVLGQLSPMSLKQKAIQSVSSIARRGSLLMALARVAA